LKKQLPQRLSKQFARFEFSFPNERTSKFAERSSYRKRFSWLTQELSDIISVRFLIFYFLLKHPSNFLIEKAIAYNKRSLVPRVST